MPSSNGNKKHPRASKKSKAIERQKYGADVRKPVIAGSQVQSPAVNIPAARENSSAVHMRLPEYPFLAGELKRIGILAVVVIVILIILAIILT